MSNLSSAPKCCAEPALRRGRCLGTGPDLDFRWWRGRDLNPRPSGYEPPDQRPRRYALAGIRPGQRTCRRLPGRRPWALVGVRAAEQR
jgi:hypothetical protein